MGRLGMWWRRPDHFDHLASLLQSRGMAGRTRATIALIGASLAILILATIWSDTGPRAPAQLACALAAAAGAASGALLWTLRWPTRRQAVGFALLSSASIGLAALAQSDPLVAILACTILATMAGYIAVFHGPPLMLFNFAIAALAGAVQAVRITAGSGVVSAVCAYTVILTLNLSVPFGIQAVAQVLGVDAMRAERDQLTGLLNRRAFHRRAARHLQRDRALPEQLVVTVIDLDRFKQLNDRYGHSAGDAALVAVACALRECAADTALLARVGGEEFVVADLCNPSEVGQQAQRICDAIAALPFGLTASVGTADADGRPGALDPQAYLDKLICAADAAMYIAKRRGGNQIWHYQSDYREDGVSA